MECILGRESNVAVLSVGDELDQLEVLKRKFDCVLVKTDPTDYLRLESLKREGFCFHDRTLCGGIQLSKLAQDLDRYVRFSSSEEGYEEELLELAGQTFFTDKRFHLNSKPDSVQAKQMIEGYLDQYRKEGARFLVCRYQGKAVGFTTVCERSADDCENVLGAVLPEYQSKGVAISLYIWMCRYVRELGYERLYGNISTQNPASLNLHISLGARFEKPVDAYIYNNRSQSAGEGKSI